MVLRLERARMWHTGSQDRSYKGGRWGETGVWVDNVPSPCLTVNF